MRARVHARERACVPTYSFKIVWILDWFFCGIHNDNILSRHFILVTLRCAMAEEDFTFCGFGSLTALHSMLGCKPHIVLIYLVLFDADMLRCMLMVCFLLHM